MVTRASVDKNRFLLTYIRHIDLTSTARILAVTTVGGVDRGCAAVAVTTAATATATTAAAATATRRANETGFSLAVLFFGRTGREEGAKRLVVAW